MSAYEHRTAARAYFSDLLDSCTNLAGVVDLTALLHRSTLEQDAATELGWDAYADELQRLTALAQTRAELGQL